MKVSLAEDAICYMTLAVTYAWQPPLCQDILRRFRATELVIPKNYRKPVRGQEDFSTRKESIGVHFAATSVTKNPQDVLFFVFHGVRCDIEYSWKNI
eukprot:scaffold1089_cov117-Cylindrotheca_fusiformis.AAC.10